MTEQPTSAVTALLALARRSVDDEAAHALVAEAARELTGRTIVGPEQQLEPLRFTVRRHHDVTGVSGEGAVADGVLWPDGTASVRWRGVHPSSVFWDRGRVSVEFVHGHQGATEIVMIDQDDEQPSAAAEPGTVPLRVRRVLDHALRRPVPCPKCTRLTPCRCAGADRTEARLDAVLGALAPWLSTEGAAA